MHHPRPEEITVEGILYALSDPVRVQIFSQIAGADCAKTCSAFLTVKGKNLPKSTLSQHFKILRESGLIKSERCGVSMHNTTRCKELKKRFGPLMENILKAYAIQHAPRKKSRA
jgi:DNA-binding transcriptional ArsR family regulator